MFCFLGKDRDGLTLYSKPHREYKGRVMDLKRGHVIMQ